MKKRILLLAAFAAGALGMRAQTEPQDVTDKYLYNPSFELADKDTPLTSVLSASNAELSMYGWTQDLGGNGYNNTQILDNSKGENSNYPAISAVDGDYHLFVRKSWSSNDTPNITFTTNSGTYEAGYYTVTYSYIFAQNGTTGSSLHVEALSGDESLKTSDTVKPSQYSSAPEWHTATFSFALSEAKEIALQFIFTPRDNNLTELHLDNVQIAWQPLAHSTDYDALETAIETAEGKTLGFEKGEYAPYNNIAVLELLAKAKSINRNEQNGQVDIQNLTEELNNAVWMVNAEEENAIWDASFEHEYSKDGNVQPIAWTGLVGGKGNDHNNATDVRWMWNNESNQGLNATSSGHALFTKFGATYGEQEGYTLPLKEDTYYTLKFKYSGWGNNSGDCSKDGYVTMTDNTSESLSLIPSDRLPLDEINGQANQKAWNDYQVFFKTNADGNYVLGLRKEREKSDEQSQYVYGDFEFFKTTVEEAKAYYATVAAEVSPVLDEYEYAYGEAKEALEAAINETFEGMTVNDIFEAAAKLPELKDAFVKAQYEVKVTAAGYATYVTPEAVTFGEDVEAFVVRTADEVAHMESIASAPAHTPVVIKAEAATYTFEQTAQPAEVGENLLKISDGSVTQGAGIYVLANLEGVGFYALSNNLTLPKGRVYLNVAGSESKFIGFDFDEATGINAVEQMANESVVIYNLAGQRVQNPTRGIYIVNGKKVLVK